MSTTCTKTHLDHEEAEMATKKPEKIVHQDINLKFGTERAIEYNWAARDRNWSCLRNMTQETNRSMLDSARDRPDQEQDLQQLLERKKALELEAK